jgi:4'-phosphopantetheinyl transferase
VDNDCGLWERALVELFWLALSTDDVPTDDEWLSTAERSVLAGLRFDKRRRDWRLGRYTAKQALSQGWYRVCGRSAPPELPILAAADGAPEIRSHTVPCPSFSLSHSGDRGLCVIATPGTRVGCDLERVEPRAGAFLEDFFAPEEQARVAALPAEHRDLAVTLTWSAKESALKLLRTGLRVDTRTVVARWRDPLEHDGWHPLEVCVPAAAKPLSGWWQTFDDFVLTATSEPAAPAPTPL